MRIGLIGCGNIGLFLLKAINHLSKIPDCKIISILDERDFVENKLSKLAEEYQCTYYQDIDPFLNSDLDLVVEAANVESALKYVKTVLGRKINLLLASVGALSDDEFYSSIQAICKENNAQLYIPSGAVGGLDLVKAAEIMGELESVEIKTSKPPHSLSDHPEELQSAKTIFDGIAKKAIKEFPKNTNVSIALSLAGIGADKTKVRILADPMIQCNTHEVTAIGTFGHMNIKIEANPMPNNPKTSYLAALSVLSVINQLNQPIKII